MIIYLQIQLDRNSFVENDIINNKKGIKSEDKIKDGDSDVTKKEGKKIKKKIINQLKKMEKKMK